MPAQRLSLQPAPAELPFGLQKLCTAAAAAGKSDSQFWSSQNSNPLSHRGWLQRTAAGALLVTRDLMARTAVAC